MYNVLVASKNPVKVNAVKRGFALLFPSVQFNFDSYGAPSGVPDQPMGEEETLRGALNRLEHVRNKFATADYWVGIEGGLLERASDLEVFAWIVISNGTLTGKAKTATFLLPPAITALIREGKELGEADDIVFGVSNSKQTSGSVGILTDNAIDRTQYYEHAVALALIPFKNNTLYAPTS